MELRLVSNDEEMPTNFGDEFQKREIQFKNHFNESFPVDMVNEILTSDKNFYYY